MGLLDIFSGGGDDPESQAQMAAAMAAFSMGGPSRTPISLGQVLSGAMQAGSAASQAYKDRQAAEALKKLQMEHLALTNEGTGLDISGKKRAIAQADAERQAAIDYYSARQQPVMTQQQPAIQQDQQPLAIKFGADGNGEFQSTPSAIPGSQPSRIAQVMQPQGDKGSAIQSRIDDLNNRAAYMEGKGLVSSADNYRKQALELEKSKPKFSTDFRQAKGPDGQMHNYVLADDGTWKDTGLGVQAKIRELNLGGITKLIDENTYNGPQSFEHVATPGEKMSNSLGWANLNFQKEKSAKEDAPIAPENIESIAQLIASNRMPPLSRRDITTPTGMAIMKRVSDINGNYSANDIATMGRAEKDFATGKQGNSVRSFNVALSHLDTLSAAADALHNRDIQGFNKVGNFIASQTGAAAPTNFDATKKIVADEIVKAIVGTGGGVSDREEAAKTINSANSPAQLKGVINQYKELMVGQLKGLEGQYKSATGKSDFHQKFLSDEARAVLANKSQSGGEAKTATLADIAATAAKSGKSTAQVTADLRARGYTIGGQ